MTTTLEPQNRWVSGPLHVEREPAIRAAREQYRELMG
jgi:hypothetical protein